MTVQVSDGAGGTDTQAIAVTVTPVNDNNPVITSDGGGATAAVSVAENTTAVTDRHGHRRRPAGPDADLLDHRRGGRGQVHDQQLERRAELRSPPRTTRTRPTPARNNVYDVTVQVSDGSGGTDTQAIAVTVTPVNDNNPVITSNGGGATAAVSVAENTTAVTTVTATDADLPAQTLTYSIIGGADAAKFTINAQHRGAELPRRPPTTRPDRRRREQRLRRDRAGQRRHAEPTRQAIAVTVTAVNDNNPVITSNGGGATAAVNVAENTTAVTTVTATDADLPAQTLTYSITGGADAAQFTINASTGALSFVAAPDYESPTDAGGEQRLRRDGPGQRRRRRTDTQAIAVTVTPVNDNNPVITSNGGGADGGGQRGREHHGRHDRHRDRRRPAGADPDLLDQRRGRCGQVHDQRQRPAR